jgi:hypothetical protein
MLNPILSNIGFRWYKRTPDGGTCPLMRDLGVTWLTDGIGTGGSSIALIGGPNFNHAGRIMITAARLATPHCLTRRPYRYLTPSLAMSTGFFTLSNVILILPPTLLSLQMSGSHGDILSQDELVAYRRSCAFLCPLVGIRQMAKGEELAGVRFLD